MSDVDAFQDVQHDGSMGICADACLIVGPQDRPVILQERLFGRRGGDLLVSCGGALVLHTALILLLIVKIVVRVAVHPVAEVPVTVVVEAPRSRPPPTTQARPPGGMPDIADEETKSNAPRAPVTVNDTGTDKTSDGGRQTPDDRKDSAQASRLPDWDKGETPTAAATTAPDLHRSGRLAPPGPARQKASANAPDPAAKHATAAIKKHPIACGENALLHFHSVNGFAQAEVVALLTRDQALAVIAKNEIRYDMHVNPHYLDNTRVSVHVDGSPKGMWKTVLLPAGLDARPGDRLEFRQGFIDPADRCRFIPNLAVRLL